MFEKDLNLKRACVCACMRAVDHVVTFSVNTESGVERDKRDKRVKRDKRQRN